MLSFENFLTKARGNVKNLSDRKLLKNYFVTKWKRTDELNNEQLLAKSYKQLVQQNALQEVVSCSVLLLVLPGSGDIVSYQTISK